MWQNTLNLNFIIFTILICTLQSSKLHGSATITATFSTKSFILLDRNLVIGNHHSTSHLYDFWLLLLALDIVELGGLRGGASSRAFRNNT